MDLIAVMTLLTPFIMKTGETIAENAGETLWTWIKNAFSAEEEEQEQLPDFNDSNFQEKIEKILVDRIKIDEDFKKGFQVEVEKAEKNITESRQQNIKNIGNIEKQIIIQQNSGNIQM